MFYSRPARKVRAYRPRLEALEDRTLLSTYLVDHLADDTVGTGLNGSLRYCMTQATDGDAIRFGVTGTISLGASLPTLTHNVAIQGPGATVLTIAEPGPYGFSDTVLTVAPGATVSISGLTFDGPGYVPDGVEAEGAFYNEGTLSVAFSTVRNFTASHGGGAFSNMGTLTLDSTTVSENYAVGEGGGIANYLRGTLMIINSTIASNWVVLDGSGSSVGGGGVWNEGSATIQSSTISGNRANFGGGIFNTGRLNMRNSVLAGNLVSDLDGGLDSGDHNLIGGNPLLGPLQNNGGPTKTMAPLAGSPALNAGDPAQLGVADQRGVVRRGGVNVGAYQASASAFVLTAPATVTAGTPFDVTVRVVDIFGQTALGYTGTVTFSTTDPNPAVVLPAAYTFTAGDQGTHTFSGGFTLLTPGAWALTAADLTGGFSASVSITVTGGGGGGPAPSAPRPPNNFAVGDRLFAALPAELAWLAIPGP
jgi:hypothetical protein